MTDNILSKATLQPTTQFVKFHEEINKFVKLSIAAVDHLMEFDSDAAKLTSKISNLVFSAGERWTKVEFKDAHSELTTLRAQMSEAAVVRVYASVETFVDKIDGSYEEFSVAPSKPEKTSQGDDMLAKIFERFGWHQAPVSDALIMVRFYSTIRHRSGRGN